uniref:adenosine deaminase n=1 Tax=Angiostrongylus cantonensis TaxID=6313 RepID=A0A158P9E7_ANGCA
LHWKAHLHNFRGKYRNPDIRIQVELHLHLDGCIRFSTLLELSLARGTPLKGARTVEELKKVLVTNEPANLSKVLEAFDLFLPVVRIAYEMCEDQAANGVIYFEGRYSPHLLCVPGSEMNAVDVVEAVKRGFDRGEAKFGVKARSIICCIRGLHQYADDVLQIATNYRHLGVVAIDVAGSAHGADEQYEQEVVNIFKEAFKRGIHRTIHAGESGGATEVLKAITDMHAERIGHGYHVMRDPEIYKKYFIEDKRIHLEACPYSSAMTGSVSLNWKNHPIAAWVRDKVNFSISRDDPTCFDNTMLSELQLAKDEIADPVGGKYPSH